MDQRNRKRQWGIILGEPTDADYQFRHLIGLWVDRDGAHHGAPRLLFYTKQEAQEWGNNRSKTHEWNYLAKKYNPRISNEP